MKKNLVYGLLLLFTLSVSLNSCRTDEMMTGTEQAQKEKIAFFERFEQEKKLSKNASSTNYALPFGNSMLAYFEKYPEKKTELENKYGIVDLKVSSQDIGGDEGDNRKLLFFPMLKDGKVTAVIAGVINAERDYLYFDVHQNTNSDVIYLINKFQHYYDTKIVSRNSNNPIDVGEVIIRVTRPVKLTMYDVWSGGGGIGSGGHDMGGGPGDYGGGGSGSTPNTPNTTNPCEQTKNIVNKPEVKDSLKALKTHAQTATKKERGFQELKSGTLVKGQATTDNQLFFGIGSNSLGTVHTHQPGTIEMFAPRDIMTFLDIVRAQDANAVGNAYSGMVSSTGTYFINFTGTVSDLPPDMTDAQEAVYVSNLLIDYVDSNNLLLKGEGKDPKQKLSNGGLEKLFNYLINTMGLSGKIILIKEENGNTSIIEYNPDGTPKIANPC